jgi:hypothetical protein
MSTTRSNKGTTLEDYLTPKENKFPSLTSKEICSIIREASQCGVKSLDFGDLRVTFLETPDIQRNQVRESQPDFANSFASSRKMSKQALEKQISAQDAAESAFLKQETLSVRQDDVDSLIIEDPAKYEELIADGELDERDEEDR